MYFLHLLLNFDKKNKLKRKPVTYKFRQKTFETSVNKPIHTRNSI